MQSHTIPATGFIREAQLVGKDKPIPVSNSTLWRWVNTGKFPKPIKLSERVTAWRCEDVRAWMDQRSQATGSGEA